MAIQIKPKDIPKYRTMFSTKQKFICPICNQSLAVGGKVALDHCHSTGLLRATLHASCNSAEGRTKAGAQQLQKTTHIVRTDYIQYLKNLVKYLESHEENPSKVLHPTWSVELGRQKPVKRRKKK